MKKMQTERTVMAAGHELRCQRKWESALYDPNPQTRNTFALVDETWFLDGQEIAEHAMELQLRDEGVSWDDIIQMMQKAQEGHLL